MKMLVGALNRCSTTSPPGHRTFLNRVQALTDNGNTERAGLGAPYGPGDASDNLVDVRQNIDVSSCPQYDVVVQLTEPILQTTNGVDENATYVYTVTVSNSGPDGVVDLPFYFGLYTATSYRDSQWVNLWSIDNPPSCVASGGAVLPQRIHRQIPLHAGGRCWYVVWRHDLPDLSATIPYRGGGLFCSPSTSRERRGNWIDGGHDRNTTLPHAALPTDLNSETNIEISRAAFIVLPQHNQWFRGQQFDQWRLLRQQWLPPANPMEYRH
ncbi:MAG: hypothetical protein R2911_28785 [Caldilineaceae bacterium]